MNFDVPGELPNHCFGLIPCTPLPTLGPMGLTATEVQTMGVAYGTVISVSLLFMIIIAAVIFTAVVYAATAHRN